MTRGFSRAAVAVLLGAMMASGCAVDANSLAKLLNNAGVAAGGGQSPQAVGEPGVGGPAASGIRPGLRRPVPTPPPQAARPAVMPMPALPEPWMAPAPEPQRFQGTLAFLPDEPVGPAGLRALAALAELEAEFNLSTLTLLDRKEVLSALGGELAPWDGGGLISAGAGDEGEFDEGDEPGFEGGAELSDGGAAPEALRNHGGVLVSNNEGSAIVRLPVRPSARRTLAQVTAREAALVVVGPIAPTLISVLREDSGAFGRDGSYDFPSRDGRARRLSYRLEGQSLVLTWVSAGSPNAPPAKLERRVEFNDGLWFHHVEGEMGGLRVSYSLEGGHGGGGYLEGPQGYISFSAVDPSKPAPIWTEPSEPEPYPEEAPRPDDEATNGLEAQPEWNGPEEEIEQRQVFLPPPASTAPMATPRPAGT